MGVDFTSSFFVRRSLNAKRCDGKMSDSDESDVDKVIAWLVAVGALPGLGETSWGTTRAVFRCDHRTWKCHSLTQTRTLTICTFRRAASATNAILKENYVCLVSSLIASAVVCRAMYNLFNKWRLRWKEKSATDAYRFRPSCAHIRQKLRWSVCHIIVVHAQYLFSFVETVADVFGDECLWALTEEKLWGIIAINEGRGFPSFGPSWDYQHWECKTCPVGWKG